MTKGTITKILHNGQKCYAVIANEPDEFGFVVRFFYNGEVIQIPVTKNLCRKPSMSQNSNFAYYIRQMVGVSYEKPVNTTPLPELIAGEPYDEGEEE